MIAVRVYFDLADMLIGIALGFVLGFVARGGRR